MKMIIIIIGSHQGKESKSCLRAKCNIKLNIPIIAH